jgi:hypothetical protein
MVFVGKALKPGDFWWRINSEGFPPFQSRLTMLFEMAVGMGLAPNSLQ